MKKPVFFLLPILAITMDLYGCDISQHLYPVAGPLAQRISLPAFPVLLKGVFNSGNISITYVEGELCRGKWKVIQAASAGKGAATLAAAGRALRSSWDAAYGSGYYAAHVLGARLVAHARAVGSRGSVIDVAMMRILDDDNPSGGIEIQGVAADRQGNIFKIGA